MQREKDEREMVPPLSLSLSLSLFHAFSLSPSLCLECKRLLSGFCCEYGLLKFERRGYGVSFLGRCRVIILTFENKTTALSVALIITDQLRLPIYPQLRI